MTASTRRRPQRRTLITVDDLRPHAPDIDEDKAIEMIKDATALAVRAAPCLKHTDDQDVLDAAKAYLRAAILRWNDQGTGTLQSMNADVFGVRFDNRTPRQAGGFLREEIKQLKALCGTGGAYTIELSPGELEPDEPPWMEFVDP